MYVPDHQKWIQFYKSTGISEYPTNNIVKHSSKNTQTGGSIGKLATDSIVPIETILSPRDNLNNSDKAVKVN